ncbi:MULTISPECIES: cytochrome P450 [unclassified Phenylobacterium]|uniref:cytochrome P450 n=1 Tax=unclassified Phenylobacterium TaxID=2640670 RepID=UPI00083A5D68|nr:MULTISPECIES: cytochrome P450 [unclassified Phenylobacterium]
MSSEPHAVPAHVPPHLVFDFDIYADPRVSDDVQASYAAAIESAPDVFYTPRNGGHWMVKRIEAISEIVRDPEHFSAREMQIPRVPNPPMFIPLSLDPPDNQLYRTVLMPRFSAKAIRELEPRIREWAVRIVDDVAGQGRCDFVVDVASRFPVSVFMELMGLPLARLREFRDLADEFFNAHDPTGIEATSARILGLLGELIALRRAEPADDLVTELVSVSPEGRKLSDDEVLAMCFVLFLGGMDTVTNVSGFAFRQLAHDPALQARLAANPGDIPKFVDEALRAFGVINTPRLVVKDCERFGAPFRAGDMVLCLLSVSGRDDQRNPDPAVFDIDRAQPAHLTFSTGPHLCIGHILARAEIRVLTEEWLKRAPAFGVEPGARSGYRIGTVTAIQSLPLRWNAADGAASQVAAQAAS